MKSEDISSLVAHPDALFINGRWSPPSENARLVLFNPATEESLGSVASAGTTDVDNAVAAARRAFDDGPWPCFTVSERAAAMRRLQGCLAKRSRSLDLSWHLQVGVPVVFAMGSSALVASRLDYYATMAEDFPFEEVRPSGGRVSRYAVVVREPVGVVAAIAPWNGPFGSLMIKLAPALAAGCTVILKPAPETPLEAMLLAEAAEEAGLPPGVINVLQADRVASDHLVRHPGVDKVAFTGSTEVGLHIAQLCAGRMARYTMELGGKSAAIVLDDYSPDSLGPALAPLITTLCGQVCINYSRVLVPRARYSQYVESLGAAMAAVRVGNPEEPETRMGPLAMSRQYARVMGYIEKGLAEGAQLATGGSRPGGMEKGYFIEPTIFSNVSNDMLIAREEIFGPVAAVIPYDDVDEAVRMANDTPYGLSGGVFTNDADRAYAVARRIRTGHFTQNGREFDLTNPFGGFKKSGVGREGGREGLEAFTEVKSVFLSELPSSLSS